MTPKVAPPKPAPKAADDGKTAAPGKTPPSKGEELNEEALAAVTGGQSVPHHRT